jgi:competence protein ComEA
MTGEQAAATRRELRWRSHDNQPGELAMTFLIPTRRSLHRIFRGSLAALATAVTLGLATASAHAESVGSKQVAPASDKSAPSGFVNLNSASEEELMRLPGIGPSKARAILELRAKLGRFSRLEDVLRVKGIGRKTFRDLQPMLRLDGATTLAAQKRPARTAGKASKAEK